MFPRRTQRLGLVLLVLALAPWCAGCAGPSRAERASTPVDVDSERAALERELSLYSD
jgi:hypothetical protein